MKSVRDVMGGDDGGDSEHESDEGDSPRDDLVKELGEALGLDEKQAGRAYDAIAAICEHEASEYGGSGGDEKPKKKPGIAIVLGGR